MRISGIGIGIGISGGGVATTLALQVHVAHGILDHLLLGFFICSDLPYVALQKRWSLQTPALVPQPLGVQATLCCVPVVLDGVLRPTRHSPCDFGPPVSNLLVSFDQDSVLLFVP